MPAIKRVNIAATGDALNGLKFKTHARPTLVTLAGSSQAAGMVGSYSVGSEKQLCVDAAFNIEISADVVDTARDLVLVREPAPPGEHFFDITALGTASNFWLSLEEL